MGYTAEYRTISRTVVNTDKFHDMPMASKLLYFCTIMQSDDSGFCDNMKMILTAHRIGPESIEPLIDGGYLYDLGGVYLIRHWHIHAGTVPTMYGDLLERLTVQNGVYNFRDGEA